MDVIFNKALADRLRKRRYLRWWMVKHLPMGFLSGMKIVEIDETSCRVELKNRWWLRNPFGSVFWAVMSMAAELSSGALIYAWCAGSEVQFILVGVEGRFYKKLKSKSFYFCPAGREVLRSLNTIENAGDNTTATLPVKAYDEAGLIVAEYNFTWSLKIPDQL